MPKPLLLLDVDGVLNPFGGRPGEEPEGFRQHLMRPRAWIEQHPHLLESDVPDLPVWLHPDHGAELLDLPYDLVWATTWETDANRYIGPAIGLPPLPVVRWTAPHAYPADGTYFKTADIVRFAAGRPFAWVDDQLGQADRDYVARHHPGPALLYDTDDAIGLGLDDFEELARWAGTLSAST